MKLNFSMSELIHSDTAFKYNINNMPDISSMDRMLELIVYCLQPLRDKIGKPVNIVGGYRSYSLWKKLKEIGLNPAKNSQHMTGEAADLSVKGMTKEELFHFIRLSEIEFDQLIWEQDNNCVHISYRHNKNRKQVLIRNKNHICRTL